MRKFFLFFLLISLLNSARADTFHCGSFTISGKVVAASDYCLIVESTDEQGNPLFWVLAQVLNTFLPDMAQFACIRVLGKDNQEICNAVYDGLNFITSLRGVGKKALSLIRSLAKGTAERGVLKSALAFTADSWELAQNIKSTIDAYGKLKMVNWEEVTGQTGERPMAEPSPTMFFNNVTNRPILISVSADGVNWNDTIIPAGRFFEYRFWQANGYTGQDYGFVKGDQICNYQVFVNRSYKLRYNVSAKKYFIELQ